MKDMISAKDFAERNRISCEKANKMAPYIQGAYKCPCCKAWFFPQDAKAIYIPDKRLYSKSSKPYAYVFEAISNQMELHPHFTGGLLDDEMCRTIVKELRESQRILILDGKNPESLDYRDYTVNDVVIEKLDSLATQEKRQYIRELLSSLPQINITMVALQ